MFRLPAALVLAATIASGQGTLWIVDDDGGAGVDFADLQLAIDTAGDGDGILVRAGEYRGNFVVDGKSLTMLGEPGARLAAPGALLTLELAALHVRNLSPSQAVTVVGFELAADDPGPLENAGGVLAAFNEGVVWLERVVASGAFAVRAQRASALLLASCSGLAHGGASSLGMDRPPVVTLEASTAALYDTAIVGETGPGGCANGLACGGARGGTGVRAVGASTLFASGGEIRGGDGEPTSDTQCFPSTAGAGGSGGHALDAGGPNSFLLLDNPVTPGLGGTTEPGAFCPDGSDGSILEGGASLTEVLGSARSLTSTTPVREGEVSQLVFRGVPGDLVFGLLSPAPDLLELLDVVGPLAVGPPLVFAAVGTLPAGGEVTIEFTAGGLHPGADFAVRYLQALHVTPASDYYLSAPTALVVLDDSI